MNQSPKPAVAGSDVAAPTGHLAYVDGRVLPAARARVPLGDAGHLLGDGLFETLRTRRGRLLFLEEHTARLRDGLRVLGMDRGLEEDFQRAVHALARAGQRRIGPDTVVRVNLSPGGVAGVSGRSGPPRVTGTCRPLTPPYGTATRSGVHLHVTRIRKWAGDPLCTVKHLSYLPHVLARREALAAGAHEGLLCNQHGRIAEAATSNLFALRGPTVHAPGPREGALPGVTRAHALEILESEGLQVTQRLSLRDLEGADEAWLTNTTGGVVPVVRVGERLIGDGRPGGVTGRLSAAFEARMDAEAGPP